MQQTGNQQCSLAETGWGQLALGPLVQAVHQPWTRYQTSTPPGDIELRLK